MHLRELIAQPINLIISIAFLLSFGLVTTSLALKSADLPDPVTGFGEYLGGKALDAIFGPDVIPANRYQGPFESRCRGC